MSRVCMTLHPRHMMQTFPTIYTDQHEYMTTRLQCSPVKVKQAERYSSHRTY